MCGRYVITNPVNKTKNIIKKSIKVENDINYNAHPSQDLPIIKKYTNGNTLEKIKWGIVPSWAKNKDFKALINARLETINEKVSFKNLIKKTRCVSVMDGFYEWKREGTIKTPYYFSREDKKTMYVAAIYNNNEFCLITEEAEENIKQIHHRQPVTLNEEDIEKYLDASQDDITPFLNNRRKTNFDFYEISKDVNKPQNNSPSLLDKVNLI